MTKEPRLNNGERTVSSINGVGKTDQSHAKEWNWTTISSYKQKLTRNGLKIWMLIPETLKLLEEHTSGKLLDISLGNDVFWNWHQKQK